MMWVCMWVLFCCVLQQKMLRFAAFFAAFCSISRSKWGVETWQGRLCDAAFCCVFCCVFCCILLRFAAFCCVSLRFATSRCVLLRFAAFCCFLLRFATSLHKGLILRRPGLAESQFLAAPLSCEPQGCLLRRFRTGGFLRRRPCCVRKEGTAPKVGHTIRLRGCCLGHLSFALWGVLYRLPA